MILSFCLFYVSSNEKIITIFYRESQHISDSIVMQIKILMDIPEHIWSAIDNQHFLLATQLFKVAQHINYSLKFEVGNSELANKYPIVGKQWGIISQFKSVIFNECNDVLQCMELSKEVFIIFIQLIFLNDVRIAKILFIFIVSCQLSCIFSIT